MSIRYLLLRLTLVCGMLTGLGVQASEMRLAPFEASFEVTRNGLSLGYMDLQLNLNADGAYHYSSQTRANGFVALFFSDTVQETSEGVFDGAQILPQKYEYRQSNRKREKLTQLEFDWDKGRVLTESKGTRWYQELPSGTHDKYSQQLALRLDLASGKPAVSYPVADGGRIKTYHFKVEGEEFIETPQGRLKCLKVRRSKEEKPPDFTIWLAEALDYLPVRLERKQSHGRYRMELATLKMTEQTGN
jgi:hypothetical protein